MGYDALSNHYATSVYHDGYVYGYHGRQEFGQSLRAIELKTGKVQWNFDHSFSSFGPVIRVATTGVPTADNGGPDQPPTVGRVFR